MAITYQSASTLAYSTGNPAANYPSSLAAGDLILLLVGSKPDTTPASTPTGFLRLGQYAGGAGTTGADTGPTVIDAFVRVSDGTETGTLSVTVTGNSASWAQMYRYSNATGLWNLAVAGGADASTGTAWSVTCDVNPGITADDALLIGSCIPTDVSTPSQFSAESVSATGATLGSMSEISEPDTTSGNDVGGFVFRMTCSAGTSSAAPVITATAGGTTTNVSGPSILIRIREVSHSEENEDFETGASEGGTYGNSSGLADGGNGGAVEWRAAAAAEGTYGVRFPVTSALNRVLTCANPNYMGFAYFAVGMSGTATATGILSQFRDAGANTLVNVRVNASTGTLTIRDNNTDRATSTTTIPTDGSKIYVGYGIYNGLVQMRIWDSSRNLLEDESTLNGTYSGAGGTTPVITELRFGAINTLGAVTVDYDYMSYSTDDWVIPLDPLSTTYEATGTVAIVSTTVGDVTREPLVLEATGTIAIVAATAGAATGLIEASGTVAVVSGVQGDATRAFPEVSGTVAAVSGVQGAVTALMLASGSVAAVSATQGAVTATLQASGTIPIVSGTAGAVTNLTSASGTVAVVSGVAGDATRVPLNLAASGTVAAVSGVSGNVTTFISASGTVVAVSGVSGDATRVPIVYAASGTVAAVSGVAGDATRVTLTLAAAGTVAAISGVSGDATRVLQTLAASGTVPVVSGVQGNPTRVPIVYQASGTVSAVVTTSGDASIVFVPPSGGPDLLVPLSPERDRDLARR